MHPAKKFFYVCGGLFLLAASYQMGVRTAQAQVGQTFVGALGIDIGNYAYVMTASGDVYARAVGGGSFAPGPPVLAGNFWSATGPVNVQHGTLGQLKTRFRDPAPTGR